MVVSRSDSKRRKKEEADPLQESPKRTKVHAQRKFAQGSHLNSPVLTPVKDKDKTKFNGAVPPAELLPIKRPKTEQFVNFLVFRGSDMLPKSLEFFNEPSVPEPLGGEDEKRDRASTSGGPSRSGHRTSDKHGDQSGSVAKAEVKNKSKSKPTAAVQALKKKYQEQRMNKEKRTLTKLALKVKGKNMVRTRSAGPLDEKPLAPAVLQKKPVRSSTPCLVSPVKTSRASSSTSRKPVLRKHPVVVKRIPSKSVTRGGLRSSGGVPPGSDEGLITVRKPRKIIKIKPSSLKKSVKKPAIASSLSDFSSDDDQPLVKKQRTVSKASILASRVTTRSRLMSKPSQSTSSRPSRKTKEAATLFMEMLKKDLRSPDEEEDNVDTMSVDSYENTSKHSERRGSRDSTGTNKSERKSITKTEKKETKTNLNKSPIRNNRKLPDKPGSRLTSLKTRTLRRNSYRLVSKELELKRLKTTRAKLITRMSSRSSSKEMSQDNSTEIEKSNPKTPSSDRDSRRETRSNPSKISETKSKQHKAVTKESDLSASKLNKKKSPENTFDDSDEEPLGKKVNQSKSPSSSKSPKKAKPVSEKEENSRDIKVDVDQKLTRRRSLNTIQDSLKDDKQSTQTNVKSQQASKKTSSSTGSEVKGKVKTETTSKSKSCNNNSETVTQKFKQISEGTNETSINDAQKTKVTGKNIAKNKAQIERNVKKSMIKESENETDIKPLDTIKNLSAQHKQVNKTARKIDSKKDSSVKGNEVCSIKDGAKVSTPTNKPISQPENVPKNEDALATNVNKVSLEKCNNLSMSKKKVVSTCRVADKAVSKNNLALANSTKSITQYDTLSSADASLPEAKKGAIGIDKPTSTPCLPDTNSCKTHAESVTENLHGTLQTKPDQMTVEKGIINSLKTVGKAKKIQLDSKNISSNELSGVESSPNTKVETRNKDEISKELEDSKTTTLTSNIGNLSLCNTSLLNTSKDGSNSKEITDRKQLNKTKEISPVENLSPVDSQDVVPSKVKRSEKLKEENLKTVQVNKKDELVKTTNKSEKYNLESKLNEENCNKQLYKSGNNQKNAAKEITGTNDVDLHELNKVEMSGSSFVTGPQMVDSKLNESASFSKGSSNEKELKPDPKTCQSGSATLTTNTKKSVLVDKYSAPIDVGVSRGALHTQQNLQPSKQQDIQKFSTNTPGDRFKIKNVVLEPLLSRSMTPEVKCLPASPTFVTSDFKGNITEQSGIKETMVQNKSFRIDTNKLAIKQETLIDNSSKLGSLDMADKISSAVETLMSLKNVHKIDDKSFTIQTCAWNKSGQTLFEVEHKKAHDLDLKRESDQKPLDCSDSKKIKIKEGEVKRVTIQEPEYKRFSVPEPDNKRPNPHESDFRKYQVQDHKPKLEHPQVLKGCSNPKSMLKPGTLIDIAGISHSPEIMTPLRPGVDGEIIPMNRPIRPFGQEVVDPFKAGVQGFKPYEPRLDPSTFGHRWQGPSSEKSSKEQLSEKEAADLKSKPPVNESAWRLAFKNVKDPKSTINVPTEKPVTKKQFSVTALAKKHKSKNEIVSDKITPSHSSTSIPFLRHNKPFLGPSPTKIKEAGSVALDIKKSSSTDVDPASLREKEAEVEEFLRQCGEYSRSLVPAVTHINPSTPTKAAEDVNKSSILKSPYLPSHNDSPSVESSHSEQTTGNQHKVIISSDFRHTSKKSSQLDQPEPSTLFGSDSVKRAGSPLKFEKIQIKTGLNTAELPPINKTSLMSMSSQQDQGTSKQSSSPGYLKPDQSMNIFQIDSMRRSNSPKSFMQKGTVSGEQSPTVVGTQHTSSALSSPKQIVPDKVHHFSPNRSGQSVVPDNFFRDNNLTKRTKSPTLLSDSFCQQSSSPKGNSISRNTNSPVFGKCSTNIFKEIVPAKRSYSPTLSSSHSDSEAVPNVFSQNQTFRRSVSPLSNRSGFQKLGTTNDNNIESTVKAKVIEEKKNKTFDDGLKNSNNVQTSVGSSMKFPMDQQLNNVAVNCMPQGSHLIQPSKAIVEDNLIVKEEVKELNEEKHSNSVTCEDGSSVKMEIKPFIPGSNEKQQPSSHDIESGNGATTSNVPVMSEAKHRLPLPVEQTLKKLGQTRASLNKKPASAQKVKTFDENIKNIQAKIEDVPSQEEYVEDNLKDTQNVFTPKMATGIYSHNQEEELDLMQKKKVNMSAEEIKRWLNDSSTSEVDHRVNCGILENNTCECEYRSTLTPSLQNIDQLKFETVSKNDIILNKQVPSQFDASDPTKAVVKAELNLSTPDAFALKPPFSVKESDEKNTINDIKEEVPSSLNASSVIPKVIDTPKKNTAPNKLKEEGLVSIKNFCVPVSVGSSISTSTKQSPTTPPVNKLRTFRLPNKNKDIEQKPSTSDTLEVSPPARDDGSSSNDLSSSNEETPEKSHERKSIFHQRRSALKVKERRELLAPSVNAFSPENESSVYAFDPELPPTSTPFRRSKGKDGKSSTTTDDEDMTPSSNSIAVQVNFDNEAVLECSTQTDVQEGDDDDTHTFYIPLQQSAADTSKPPLIQGVAVKVDTEGPDQKVIMRAKLVTKPLSTFNQSSPSPRGLIGTRSGKPEQKVRPLSVKPPVGTVQPTARPKPKPAPPQDDQPGPSKAAATCSPQAARLAKRIKSKAAVPSTSAENHPPKVAPAKLVEAPTFYPTEKEFEDPLEYISSITPQAEKYGLCRVVPPSNFKPECKVSDDMRFTAYNQYIHKMLHRWGPNVKEMLAIKKYLATQSIALTHPPWIGGMEVDLPRLYQTVQQCGGLKEVIEKKRWHRVADLMKIPKSAQDRVTKLDDIYCKFLLPYDTLSHVERTQLFEGVERDWVEREKRVANQEEAAATDEDEDSDSDSDSDIDECIVKGRSMALNGFYRIARNTMSMWFPKTDTPSAADVELEFWKHVASRQHHVCVHSGSIDSGAMGYGFPTGKNSSTSRHPWNLKMLTNNPGSILRFLGPIMGVTVPTLHVGMLFSACCWYRDPHGLPWIEYLHTGASKIWYGIPDSSSSQFRDAVMDIVPRLCRDKSLWLASDTAMVPPPLLVEKGVSLSRIVQDPGQFIVVFPKAFTSSICTGYLVSESVYFAQPSWLSTAHTLFNDMRESSEPTVFSLEKLLFSIVNDSRAGMEVLNQILNIVVSLRDGEVAGRRQLEELGLNTSERLNSKRKGKARPAGDGEEDLECEECRMTLFISWMTNSQDDSVYCLPHAVELLSNKRSLVKHCTLVYAFSEEELEELVEKLKSRVENKNQKKSVAKGSRS